MKSLEDRYIPTPLFAKNKEWYYFDEEQGKCVLTDKAPPEAVKSYEEFYNEIYKKGDGFPRVLD